jgi:hypothetical protein
MPFRETAMRAGSWMWMNLRRTLSTFPSRLLKHHQSVCSTAAPLSTKPCLAHFAPYSFSLFPLGAGIAFSLNGMQKLL